jgi:thiamine-phosphate pyrophosphorylase
LSPNTSLYPIIDTTVCRERGIEPLDLLDACLRGGARRLQIRAKEDSSASLLALAEEAVAHADRFDAQIIVNDRADVARLAATAGVHVGQTDLPAEKAIDIVGAGKIVGVSTHDREQIDRALAGPATYVAVGPIFSTATKDTGYEPRGLDLVRYAAGRGKPIVAIGGITLERASAVAAAGASAIAVITDLLVGGDPEARVRAFLASLSAPTFKVY